MVDPTFKRDPESLSAQWRSAEGLSDLTLRRSYRPLPTPLPPTKLGESSQAFMDRFKNWPQKEIGWRGTLTNAPAPQSTFGPSQKFSKEVFQTIETRRTGGIQKPWQVLKQHPNAPRLDSNLAYMYRVKNMELGGVRRASRRIT